MSSSSPETNPEERRMNRDIIWEIFRKIEDCQSIFLSPSDLQAFGVEASQVGISNDTLQFEPCFFNPHPVGIFQKYPIDMNFESYNPGRLEYVPTLQDALNITRNRPPATATEDPLEAAQELLKTMLKEYHSRDIYSHIQSLKCYFDYIIGSYREGGPPGLTLFQIGDISKWVYANKPKPIRE